MANRGLNQGLNQGLNTEPDEQECLEALRIAGGWILCR
jgi:hypothetical protein